uniref:Uncharacterized protein n=1 Tax=Anoplophora glabripennis TaxID=217634 RepID=V5GGY8_ANOGL
MPLILDMQGFKVEQNRFIVKELAAYDGTKTAHYIFKAPFSVKLLSPDLQKQVTWLTNNYHCLNWNEGYTPFHKFSNIMKELMEKKDVIYVKGKEKADYVRQYSPTVVYELEEHPPLQIAEARCFYHKKSKCMCALTNVFYLYETFIML